MDSTTAPPAPRARSLVVWFGVVVAAVAVGLLLQEALAARLAEIAVRAEQDVVEARRELAVLMRAVFFPVLSLTTVIGAILIGSARSALREARIPPSESRLDRRAGTLLTGAPARRRAGLALGLGVALVVCSLSAAGLIQWITRTLLLCRA